MKKPKNLEEVLAPSEFQSMINAAIERVQIELPRAINPKPPDNLTQVLFRMFVAGATWQLQDIKKEIESDEGA